MFVQLILILLSVRLDGIYSLKNFANVACGQLKSRTAKVVGGINALPHEFPWMVSLTRRGSHFCGGTLITDKHVLTAGHCLCTGIDEEVISPASLKISIGQHDFREQTNTAYEMAVEKIILHPGYSCRKAKNDLAMVILKKQVRWSNEVSPACLPSANTEGDYSKFSNAVATVAGWGWISENRVSGKKSSVLQKAKVNVLENETCKTWYKSQGKKTKIQETQMCAGHEQGGIDACWADSGGPLMLNSNDRVMVIGVVSTGIGCARPFLPGLYTRLSEYVPWIQSMLHQ